MFRFKTICVLRYLFMFKNRLVIIITVFIVLFSLFLLLGLRPFTPFGAHFYSPKTALHKASCLVFKIDPSKGTGPEQASPLTCFLLALSRMKTTNPAYKPFPQSCMPHASAQRHLKLLASAVHEGREGTDSRRSMVEMS